MRRIALALVTLFIFAIAAIPADAAPRTPRPSAAKSDGVWHKGYGWGGYGWYSIYGDFVGTDGYTSIGMRYRSNYLGVPGYSRSWFLSPVPSSANSYRPSRSAE